MPPDTLPQQTPISQPPPNEKPVIARNTDEMLHKLKELNNSYKKIDKKSISQQGQEIPEEKEYHLMARLFIYDEPSPYQIFQFWFCDVTYFFPIPENANPYQNSQFYRYPAQGGATLFHDDQQHLLKIRIIIEKNLNDQQSHELTKKHTQDFIQMGYEAREETNPLSFKFSNPESCIFVDTLLTISSGKKPNNNSSKDMQKRQRELETAPGNKSLLYPIKAQAICEIEKFLIKQLNLELTEDERKNFPHSLQEKKIREAINKRLSNFDLTMDELSDIAGGKIDIAPDMINNLDTLFEEKVLINELHPLFNHEKPVLRALNDCTQGTPQGQRLGGVADGKSCLIK